VTDSGEATVIVDVCPDEDGTVVATATTSASVDAAGNGLGYRVVAEADDRAVATVNAQANVASVAHTGSMSRHATGDRAVFAVGGEGSAESHLEGSTSWTSDGAGTAGPSSVEVQVAEGANEVDVRAWVLTRALAATLTDTAIKAATRVWRGGRCLELKADPPGKEVDPGSETEIEVTIVQTAHDDEVEREVTASLAGTEKVEPLDSPLMAPGPFTYTATSEAEGEGTITFESVSDRGIAKELTETYTVSQRLVLDAEGSLTIELGGMAWRNTYRARGLRVVMIPGETPDASPRVSIEGEISLRGRVRGLLGQADCTGSFRTMARVDPGPDVSAQLVGEGDDRRLSVHLWTSEPDATIDFPLRCRFPTGPTRVPYSILVRDTWPIWSGLGTPVELPLTGGSASDTKRAGAARYDSSLTLREEE
jgi:hypothetical protein